MTADIRSRALILGAGHGLGKAIAEELQRRGVATIEVGSSLDDFRHGDDRQTFHCGLASPRHVGALLEHLRDVPPFTEFWWVAGIWWQGEFANQPTSDLVRMIDVNFRNALPIAQYAWQMMRTETDPRSFVMVSSTSGAEPRSRQVAYTATKAAQVMCARSLGQEAAELRVLPDCHDRPDIRVTCFLPGGMRTNLFGFDERPHTYAEFMDPAKVAAHMVNRVTTQAHPYLEETIDRKSDLGRSLR